MRAELVEETEAHVVIRLLLLLLLGGLGCKKKVKVESARVREVFKWGHAMRYHEGA